MKKLTVEQIRPAEWNPSQFGMDEWEYRVTSVINSTTPHVSERLTSRVLHNYCEDENWEVKVK